MNELICMVNMKNGTQVEKSIVLMMTVEITTMAVIALTDEILMAKVN